MKNKIFWIISAILGLSVSGVVYSVITTNVLLYNLKARGILPPEMHYKFALASLDCRSITLYHVTSENWNNAFIYKVRLTSIPNGFSGQIHNVHMNTAQVALKLYGGTLINKLSDYKINTHFIQEWPLSIALFDIVSSQNVIIFNIQKLHAHIYQINLQTKKQHQDQLNISALIDTQNKPFQIKQAEIDIKDPSLLNQIQEYAVSKRQPVPQPRLTMPTQKNEVKRGNQDNLKLSNSK